MQRALVDGQLIPATAGAPKTALCPRCEGVVKLRCREGTYFWRHVKLPLGGCDPEQAETPNGSPAAIDDDPPDPPVRHVGHFVIEFHVDSEDRAGHHLKLRNPGAEEIGEPSGMIIYLSEVRPLTAALREAVAYLAGLAVGDRVRKS